jgi:uncharacterized protein YegL
MTNSRSTAPGGPYAPRRDVHFFWLLDGSTSMVHEHRLNALNYAVKNAIREMKEKDLKGEWRGNVLVRALRFATDVEWIIEKPTPIAQLQWTDISADGETAMGKALLAVAHELEKLHVSGRYYPPVIVLVTDGEPTDRGSFERGLDRLLSLKLGRESKRIAVAIKVGPKGVEYLKKFSDVILHAQEADQIVANIVIASTGALKASGNAAERAVPGSPADNVGEKQ